MEAAQPEQTDVEDIRQKLKDEGVDPEASAEEQLCYVWRLFLRSRDKLHSATSELEQLRQQQVDEMREVENYVSHVRYLTEARDALATEFEKENKQLRMEFSQLQLEHGSQQKEVEEMLEQEGLLDIAHSGPSEQIAYLLVERSTLLEKLEGMAQKLGPPSCFESLCAAQLQVKLDHIHQPLEDKPPQQHESINRTEETTDSSDPEELARERALREHLEQDLDEAAHRLQVAHQEIQRLTEELGRQKKEQGTLEASELQKAKELNLRLDKEILALRNRVRFLSSERKAMLGQAEKLQEEILESRESEEDPRHWHVEMNDAGDFEGSLLQGKKEAMKAEEASELGEATSDDEGAPARNETLHRRTTEEIERHNSQLRHKLGKLEQEHEELVERNEELESLLGEMQNQSREERQLLEHEVDGLQDKISCLEEELREAQKNEKVETEGSTTKEMQDHQEMLGIQQEKLEVLESKLSEETEWRKQLGRDLEKTRQVLKDEKKELDNAKSELLRLHSELQMLQEVAEERDFLNVTHEKLQQENSLLESKVSELYQECQELKRLVTEQKDTSERLLASGRTSSELLSREGILEDQVHSLGEEKQQLCAKLSDSSKKIEELEKQAKGSDEEKQLMWEENAQLRKDVLALRHQLNNALRAKDEAAVAESWPLKPQNHMWNTESDMNQCLPGERLLWQQQQEEFQQLRQDFQRVQNVCNSAEKELRYEREKNLELKKHNILLQQENIKVKAELRQVQLKLSDSSKNCSSLTSQWELSRQKVKELELELLKHSQAIKQQSSLQEKLAQEKTKAAEAEKRILELQQKLKESDHQARLSEAHILGQKQLEQELKEAREKEVKTQRQFQEEQRIRKLLDRQTEDLQQQLRHSLEKETQLHRTFAKLQVQCQQQEAQLKVLEEEKKTLSNEHLHCQKYSQKLSEQLLALQQEKEAFHEEYSHVLQQVDISVRKHNERHLRHKAKLRKAKETFIYEVKLRDTRIRELESETMLTRSQVEKDQLLIRRVTAENESLLQEKRELLQQLHEQEEVERSNRLVLSTTQNRVQFLDEENKQLQEHVLQLRSHVGSLERALRNIHNHSLEELRGIGFPECQLQSKVLPLPSISFSPMGLSDSFSLLKAIQGVRPEDAAESSPLSPSPSQPSEMGYLNVASPGDIRHCHEEEQEQPSCSDNI